MLLSILAAMALSPPATNPLPAPPIAAAARPAVMVVDAFHAALRSGDRDAALALLADDVLILEGGGAERSKGEYAAHHLAADMAFSKAVLGTMTRRTAGMAGEMVWVASEGRTTGRYKGRAIDRVTAETVVLTRAGAGWRIVHIHWSSADPR